MKKIVSSSITSILIMIITAIVFSYSINIIDFKTLFKSRDSYDKIDELYRRNSNNLYYMLSDIEEASFTIFDNQISFGIDNNLIENIEKNDFVDAIYPYIALPISNYSYQEGSVGEIDMTINGKSIEGSLNITSTIIIEPYYPEDGYDEQMEKIYVSQALYALLDTEDILDNQIHINQVRVPIYQKNTQIERRVNEETKIYDGFMVDFIPSTMTLVIDEILPVTFNSQLYETDLAILVPYTLINVYIEDNDLSVTQEEKLPYEVPVFKVYFNNSVDKLDVSKIIKDNNNDVATSLEYDGNIVSYLALLKVIINEIFLYIAIMLVTMITNIVYLFWINKKEVSLKFTISYLICVLASTILIDAIKLRTIELSNLLIVSIVILFIFISTIILNKIYLTKKQSTN